MTDQRKQEKSTSDISFGEALLSSAIIKKRNKPSTSADKTQESCNNSVTSSNDLSTIADQKTQENSASNISLDTSTSPVIIKKKNDPSTSVDKTQKSLDDSVASSDEQNDEDYQVGDIVWAKIGKYPFWPSIVCCDPDSKNFMKGSPNKKKFSLHVRFCNDNGRRSWAKMLIKYSGKDDLLSKYPNCLSFMKNSKKQMNTWNLAVKEADGWLKFDREERWIKFSNANNIKSPVSTPTKSNSSSSVTVSNKSPDNTIASNTDDTTQNVSDCFVYLNTLSDGQTQSDIKKRKIIKKKTAKDKIVNPLNNLSFTCPEENYHIDDDDDDDDGNESLSSTNVQRRVPERLRCDIEKLEEEGIRKIREWKALKLAEAARAK